MPPARVPLANEPGLLERQPHEAVRQGDAMLAPREADYYHVLIPSNSPSLKLKLAMNAGEAVRLARHLDAGPLQPVGEQVTLGLPHRLR